MTKYHTYIEYHSYLRDADKSATLHIELDMRLNKSLHKDLPDFSKFSNSNTNEQHVQTCPDMSKMLEKC